MRRTLVAAVAVSILWAVWALAAGESATEANDKAASRLILPAQKAKLPQAKHFITRWLLLGPFTFGAKDFGNDPWQSDAVDKEFMPKEGELDGTQQPPKDVKAGTWEAKDFSDSGTPGKIGLGATEHAAMYAVAWVNCPETIRDARLLVGSDDYIKVWINGKLVHTYNVLGRGSEADQDTASGISLNQGENRLVVKCVNVTGGWDFYLRFADKDGMAYATQAAAAAP